MQKKKKKKKKIYEKFKNPKNEMNLMPLTLHVIVERFACKVNHNKIILINVVNYMLKNVYCIIDYVFNHLILHIKSFRLNI